MKKLFLFPFLLLGSSAFADDLLGEVEDNITCALKEKKVESRVSKTPAQIVIQLKLVGDNVYRVRSYKARRYMSQFKQGGIGGVLELNPSSDGSYKLFSNMILSQDLISLKHDVTTGSYPGAGRAPIRINTYKCILDYSENISTLTRRNVADDFGL